MQLLCGRSQQTLRGASPTLGREPGRISEPRSAPPTPHCPVKKHGAWGKEAAQGSASPQQHPARSTRGCPCLPGHSPQQRAHWLPVWGCPGRGGTATGSAQICSPTALCSGSTEGQGAAGSQEGKHKPPRFSRHPDTHSELTPSRWGSPQPAPLLWGDSAPVSSLLRAFPGRGIPENTHRIQTRSCSGVSQFHSRQPASPARIPLQRAGREKTITPLTPNYHLLIRQA